MTASLLLASAILCEVSATLTLKRALDHPAMYAVVVVGYVASFFLLTRTLRAGLGIGLAYGVWAGCGVALAAIGSKVFFNEPLNGVMIVGIVLIISGVLLVELGASR
ncbi:MAG: QacE family quaternary ammonium compound efflux SMR transporter [Nocardioides sp.]|nr:QacE family quaternary ammonium compound efflux SMR transporter [Nocardioides sp.]